MSPIRFANSVRWPSLRQQAGLRAGDVRAQPAAVGAGDHQVLRRPARPRPARRSAPTSKPHGLTNARSSSAQPAIPGARPSEIVACRCSASSPVSAAASTSLRCGAAASRSCSGVTDERPAASLAQERLERLAALHGDAELLDVAVAHPGQEVEVGRVDGRDARDGRRGRAALGQQRGAGERVRAAARPAVGGEAIGAERVEERGDVGRRVGDAAVRLRRGAGVAGRL